jgi:hypothetical protein
MQEACIQIFNLKYRKMKNVLIKVTATIFIFFFSGMISNIYSEEWIDKVVVNKKFDVKPNAKLIIDHEYGNVRCVNWDKNEISVKVTVRVKTTDADKAAKIIDRVIADVNGSTNKVEAICDLNQNLHGNNKLQVMIDFDIYMPSTVSFELDQKFGTAYIETVTGPANISSEYGSLDIGSLSNVETNLELEFGQAIIKRIAAGNIEVSYSSFKLNGSENITIEAEYSDVIIDNATSISMELEGGNANIGIVDILTVETNFSNLEVRQVNSSVVAETEYGSFTIAGVSKDFSSIVIKNEFGGVEVSIDKDASYSLDAQSEYGSIGYPEKLSDLSYKKVGHASTIIKGVVGKGTNPNSSIVIVSEYGSVDISAK